MTSAETTAINESYPVAGIDQSSQTFRDNFGNIKTALTNLEAAIITVIDDISDVDTTSTPPVANNILSYDGSNWVPASIQVVYDTTPQLGGNLDINGFNIGDGTNAILAFTEAGTPVNWFTMSNADTGNSPILAVNGSDGNIPLTLTAKGTSPIVLDNAGGGTVSLTTLQDSLTVYVPNSSSSNGKSITVRAGSSTLTNGNGGSVTLQAGLRDGTGSQGEVNIRDGSGNRVIRFRPPFSGNSAVNFFDVRNGETGVAPRISISSSTDTNVSLVVRTLGTGRFVLTNVAGDFTLSYPNADGDAGHVLKTDGAGTLDFAAPTDLGEYTVAGLPDATTHMNAYALATDASGGRTIVRSDGTDWKVVVVEGATVTT